MLLTVLLTAMMLAPLLACAMEPSKAPLVLDVWPGETPNDSGIGQYGPIAPERVRDPSDAPTKTATWITGVTHPTITVYRPAKSKNTGAAFICVQGAATGTWPGIWRDRGRRVAPLKGSPVSSSSIGFRAVPERRSPSPPPVLSWMPSAPSASCGAKPRSGISILTTSASAASRRAGILRWPLLPTSTGACTSLSMTSTK